MQLLQLDDPAHPPPALLALLQDDATRKVGCGAARDARDLVNLWGGRRRDGAGVGLAADVDDDDDDDDDDDALAPSWEGVGPLVDLAPLVASSGEAAASDDLDAPLRALVARLLAQRLAPRPRRAAPGDGGRDALSDAARRGAADRASAALACYRVLAARASDDSEAAIALRDAETPLFATPFGERERAARRSPPALAARVHRAPAPAAAAARVLAYAATLESHRERSRAPHAADTRARERAARLAKRATARDRRRSAVAPDGDAWAAIARSFAAAFGARHPTGASLERLREFVKATVEPRRHRRDLARGAVLEVAERLEREGYATLEPRADAPWIRVRPDARARAPPPPRFPIPSLL